MLEGCLLLSQVGRWDSSEFKSLRRTNPVAFAGPWYGWGATLIPSPCAMEALRKAPANRSFAKGQDMLGR